MVERVRIEDLYEDLEEIENGLTEVTPQGRKKKGNRTMIVNSFKKYINDILSRVDHVLKDYAEDFR